MRILVISQYFYPENFRINDFVESLKANGNNISVITAIPNYPSGKKFGKFKLFKDKYRGIELIRVPIFLRGNNRFSLFLNYFSFLISTLICYPFFFGFKKFDYILCPLYSPPTNGFIGLFVSYLSRGKLILWVQDLWPDSLSVTTKSMPLFVLNVINKFMKILYKKSSVIFVQSEMFVDEIKKFSIDENKIFYLPNWAENIFKNQTNTEGILKNDQKSILFAGNIGEAQNIEFIIELIKHSRSLKIKWVFAGDGSKFKWLKDNINKNDLDELVEILGRRPLEEMPNLFHENNFMLVSLKFDEIINKTLPGKVQSYMLCKKPIIGIISGETKRVIEDSKCGIVLDPNNIDSSINKLRDFLKLSDAKHNEMGKNGYDFYNKNFDKDVLIRKFENILKQ